MMMVHVVLPFFVGNVVLVLNNDLIEKKVS